MTEAGYIEKIREAKNSFINDELSPEPLRLVEEALAQHPNSALLHCIRGDFIQLWDVPGYELEDALKSYERAAALDPQCAEAYESMGYYHDVIAQDLERSEMAFRRAIELGAGEQSYSGLARVMAQRGRAKVEVLAFLKGSPYAEAPCVQDMYADIEGGDWAPIEEQKPE